MDGDHITRMGIRRTTPSGLRALITRHGCVVYTTFFEIYCARKLKRDENNTRNVVKHGPNPSKMMPRGPLGGARGLKAAAGGEGTQKLYIFDAHWITFGSFLVSLMPKRAPFWIPLDFEGVPNPNNSIQNQDEE